MSCYIQCHLSAYWQTRNVPVRVELQERYACAFTSIFWYVWFIISHIIFPHYISTLYSNIISLHYIPTLYLCIIYLLCRSLRPHEIMQYNPATAIGGDQNFGTMIREYSRMYFSPCHFSCMSACLHVCNFTWFQNLNLHQSPLLYTLFYQAETILFCQNNV